MLPFFIFGANFRQVLMKFCSVGAKKINKESEALDSYQYFFTDASAVPTTPEEFLNILPDVRTIGYGNNNDQLYCTPVGGYRDGKLLLSSLNISKFPSESGTVATCMPDATREKLDLFKIFGCVHNEFYIGASIRSGSRSIFYGNTPTFSTAHPQSPLKYQTKGETDGMLLSFIPNDANANGASGYLPFTMAGTVQTYRYYSTAPGYGFNVNYTYETYMCDMEFKLDVGTLKSKMLSSPQSFAGTVENTIFSNMRSGSLMVSRATQSDMASGNTSYARRYSVGDYNYTTANCTRNSALPYIKASKPDDSIQLSFSVISQLLLDKIEMIVRRSNTDFSQSAVLKAGDVPQVLLQTHAKKDLVLVHSI